MATILFNGNKITCDHSETLISLLSRLDLQPHGIAVVLNSSIIPKSSYSTTPLSEGDRLEVVKAVAGG